MKKITIIQLLNKIANGEEVPSKIKYDDFYWSWCGSCKIYETRDEENIEINLYRSLVYEGDLNDEVEILSDENEFIDIKELTCDEYDFEKIAINDLIKNQKKIINIITEVKKND